MGSDDCFDQKLISNGNFPKTDLLCFIKIKAEHISLLQVKIIKISGKLLFTSRIVSVTGTDYTGRIRKYGWQRQHFHCCF